MLDSADGRELVIQGRMQEASNEVYLASFAHDPEIEYIYKPVAGERQLWDFPDGSLAAREVAAYEIATALGFTQIPATSWVMHGPLGPGSIQVFVQADAQVADPVILVPADEEATGYLPVAHLEDRSGSTWLLAHRDEAALHEIAVMDAILNNADRKAGHLLPVAEGIYAAIDHGVSLHQEQKLRTVLWGWAGEEIDERILRRLETSQSALDECQGRIEGLITRNEWAAVVTRVRGLVDAGACPEPGGEWPVLPWPLF